MKVVDKFLVLLAAKAAAPRLNYRQDGIALAGKLNFAKVIPKKNGTCLLILYGSRLPEGSRENLEAAGFAVQSRPDERFSIQLDDKALEGGFGALADLVKVGVGAEG